MYVPEDRREPGTAPVVAGVAMAWRRRRQTRHARVLSRRELGCRCRTTNDTAMMAAARNEIIRGLIKECAECHGSLAWPETQALAQFLQCMSLRFRRFPDIQLVPMYDLTLPLQDMHEGPWCAAVGHAADTGAYARGLRTCFRCDTHGLLASSPQVFLERVADDTEGPGFRAAAVLRLVRDCACLPRFGLTRNGLLRRSLSLPLFRSTHYCYTPQVTPGRPETPAAPRP